MPPHWHEHSSTNTIQLSSNIQTLCDQIIYWVKLSHLSHSILPNSPSYPMPFMPCRSHDSSKSLFGAQRRLSFPLSPVEMLVGSKTFDEFGHFELVYGMFQAGMLPNLTGLLMQFKYSISILFLPCFFPLFFPVQMASPLCKWHSHRNCCSFQELPVRCYCSEMW